MNKRYQLILCWRHACDLCSAAQQMIKILEKEYPQLDYLQLNNLQYPEFMIHNMIRGYPTWILRENEQEIKRSETNPSLDSLKYWLKAYIKD